MAGTRVVLTEIADLWNSTTDEDLNGLVQAIAETVDMCEREP
ncbi:hypothetical protein EV192_10479 [Actinocrispum wychmicini]|uniref:Uncharacterized protein n=1 Tax=Actinocrispum wychmicini TaxID=1213861 RepID=A0A4R2JPZ5_9PSEU|nr:hypothetical protein EV192_10479 [Actinocrispum wychmicini]